MSKLTELIRKKYSVAITWNEFGLNVAIIKGGHRKMHLFPFAEMPLDLDSAINKTLGDLEVQYDEMIREYGGITEWDDG